MHDRFDLEDKVVIVTGAARGIGRATARMLAESGAHVAIGDIDEAGLADTEDLVRQAGGEVVTTRVDVSSAVACQGLVDAARDAFGGVDALVNNAAIGAFSKTVESTTEDEWDHTIAVNLKSVYLMSRATIPLLRERGGGSIVNVSSIHAYATSTGVAPYAAAKGGVLALTRNMALDFAADRIRVNAVAPGAVDTPMLHSHAEHEGTTVEELGFSFDPSTIGRVGSPDEIASTILFLCSDASSFMTGSGLNVDGGMLAKF